MDFGSLCTVARQLEHVYGAFRSTRRGGTAMVMLILSYFQPRRECTGVVTPIRQGLAVNLDFRSHKVKFSVTVLLGSSKLERAPAGVVTWPGRES